MGAELLLDPTFLASVPRFVTPILLAALGGALCERAGVFNIALEGFVLVGAFAAVMGSYASGSAALGLLCAALGGVLMGLLFAEFSVRQGGDAIVVSVALNLLALGATTYLLRALFGIAGAFRDPGIVGLGTFELPALAALPVLGPALAKPVGRRPSLDVIRELSAPKTPFNASIGPHRRWSYMSVRLEDVKELKNAAGTTVNDVVLAICSGVLRSWLETHHSLPDRDLLAMVPLSVRSSSDAHAIGNRVSFTVADLATTVDDPVERLQQIRLAMIDAKASHDTLPANILTDISQVAPPAVSALASRLIASTNLADKLTLPFNVVVSNVPGPPVPLYLAGAEVLGNYPVSAIVDGVGLNITVVTTNGMLDFGFVSDRDLIPDLWDMADGVIEALNELKVAHGLKPAQRARLLITEEAITARQKRAAKAAAATFTKSRRAGAKKS